MIIMSSNQWKCDKNSPDWAARGEDCSAEGRVGGLARAYQLVTPDILGIQEASVHMTELLMQRMAVYEHDGSQVHYELITGGDTPIIYRDDKLTLIESGFFRYSESIPGFEGSFNNGGTKSYTFGVFEDKATGKRIAMMSTHLWWKSTHPESKDYQPHSAEARAYQIKQALTRLDSVSFQVGRTGAITPVANLEPVLLAGTTVRRATLHNAEQMALLDIRPGDMVYVEKGGEIIPKITGVDLSQRPADSKPFEYITVCPECGTPLVRYEGEAKHYCPNQGGCPPQIVGRIIHFIRRKAMDIEGLGEETVELLYENGLVRDVADLYDLQAPQLACLPRLGEKSADNIIRSIRGSVEVPFRRVLFGLGIRFVGETTAKYLAEHFRSLDAVMRATREELTQADEVGGRIADAIIEYFADEQNHAIIRRLRAAGLKFEEEARELASESLAGRSFVVSGKFSRSRDEMKELIEMHGGRNLAAVSANVDYIVAGDNMGPAKLRKAEKLGVKIISEEEFIAMVSGQEAPAANGTEADSATTANTGGRNNGAPAATESGDGEPVQQGELF